MESGDEAACPLSMLLMMRGMPGGQCATQPTQASEPTRTALSRQEQLAELKLELAKLQVEQARIAREIAGLEAVGPAVREAEAVARAADERARDPA